MQPIKKIFQVTCLLIGSVIFMPHVVFAQPNILDYENTEDYFKDLEQHAYEKVMSGDYVPTPEEKSETTTPYQQSYEEWRTKNVSDWNIATFDVKIQIEKTRDMTVEETIISDFTGSPHHGIIRFIPIRYQTNLGANFNLDF